MHAAPPQDFQRTLVVGAGLEGPSGFEFAPDGRVFILQRTGEIKIFKNGQLLENPFAVLPSISSGDRGLIGIAFDPNFFTNHYVYFYYTGLDKLNRLVRFNAEDDVAKEGPHIMYETSFFSEQLHVGGSIGFGPDGKIYFAVGDNGHPPNAQDLTNPHGKILRINPDGSIPSDNPFFNQNGKLPEIWAYGLRNPWRFQFDNLTGMLFGGDAGEATWEEVNHIIKGGNYGWSVIEGMCPITCPYINPIYTYNHDNKSSAVTGGPVYRGNMFPQEYQGSLFFGDYARGFIKRLTLDSQANATGVFDFDLEAGSVVDIKVAPDGSMYYLTYIPGALYRITYATDNHFPTANAQADITKGTQPLTVHFSSQGSSDPDNDPLQFLWDLGDGTTSIEANPVKTYSQKGKYLVQLTVSDGVNSAPSVPIVIQVGIPPIVTIGSPQDNSPYKAGDTIFYSASATDSAGFDIHDANITTEVLFHHGTHIHPFLGPLKGNKNGSFTTPTAGESSSDTWFEIKVTATDTNGLFTTKSVFIFPKKVLYTIASIPEGLQVLLDGIPTTTNTVIEGVVNFKRELNVIVQQVTGGISYQFHKWSDGGPLKHTVTLPDFNTTFTAFFEETKTFNGEYFTNKDLQGIPTLTRSDKKIDFSWGDGSPDVSIPSENFSVRWTAIEFFATGRYKFVTTTDDGVRLYIDGQLKIDQWHDQGPIPYTAILDLTEGNHTIVMEYYENFGGAQAKLTWEGTADQPIITTPSPTTTPVLQEGFSASYWNISASVFPPTIPNTTPSITRIDQAIDFTWNENSPDPTITVDNFAARWVKQETFLNGTYRFTATADDGIRLWIDDQLLIDQWKDQGSTTYTTETAVTAGVHTVKIEYYEHGGGAVAIVNYTKTADVPTPTPTLTPTPTQTPTGYNGQYWNITDTNFPPTIPTTPPTFTKTDSDINFTWNDGSVDPVITPDNFAARWTKQQQFTSGNYRFTVIADDGVRLKIDNTLLIDQWKDQGATTYSAEKELTEGVHEIVIEYYEHGGGAVAKFAFEQITVVLTPTPTLTPSPTSSPEGFFAEYFDNQALNGTPKVTRIDSGIAFVWNDESPDPLIPVDHFSARWTKQQQFAAGSYTFTLKSDDGLRFWIDEELLIDDWTDHSMKTYTPTITLTEGIHMLKIEYYENSGGAVAIFEQPL